MPRKAMENSITIKDIAALCNVSISTVSNVLNGRTNKVSAEVYQRIMKVVKETGYKPNYLAKNLRATSTKTIGVIVEDLIIFSTAPIVEGLMKKAEELGYSVVIENMRLFGRWSDGWMNDKAMLQASLEPAISKMEAINVDGIVYIAGYEHVVDIDRRPENIPFVIVYANSSDETIPSFKLDDEKGGYISYKYLYSMGHRNIGIIAGEPSSPHTVNRLRGIQRAMFEVGELFNPSMVMYQTWNKEGGYNGMKQLDGMEITAVLCLSDLIASGVYQYLQERNLKPGRDISVIGYDNHEVSWLLYPTLTTVPLALVELGDAATTWLINKCESKDNNEENKPVHFSIAGELIERESVLKIE
ncbi:LacI family DNA-binding transcriptional regulator [Pseudobutyrivibrio xylanivorans]|uniref:LacI family transcriptional regulator n=1 Tax=Pseudobutyrivibrio xylanivorans TaxID=185007 RepID=A0A1G5RUQ5_PSEXY|nr:LacI family DNA-binding transcriptional regulator [Pseudobutyrivibrio xylanivorans]SCZ77783.1 LacI family transcriptional regulator [Pseudobutyrivibrio xylanivorans]